VSVPSYGAYPLRTPNGTLVGYVHHGDQRVGRYRAIPRTAVDVPLRSTAFETHQAAASALMSHHYEFGTRAA
jgi:hypothetical protein